jgi:ABC-type branched-subunit amino acid transport system substrate-binding protein
VHQFYSWAFEQGLVDEGGKKIAFIVEDTDYGISNAEKIGELFGEDGWEVVGTERTQAGQTDFYPQLSKLRGLEPDIIVSVFTIPNSGIAFVRQLQEQGLEASHLGIYYPTKVEFMAEAADIAEGMFWATLQYAPDLIPEHKAFSDKIEAEFGSPAGYSSVHDYCVMVIALRALDAAGPDGGPEEIAKAISETDYQCVYGRWVFGEDHAAKDGPDFLPVPVAQIQDGENQIIWPENIATSEGR